MNESINIINLRDILNNSTENVDQLNNDELNDYNDIICQIDYFHRHVPNTIKYSISQTVKLNSLLINSLPLTRLIELYKKQTDLWFKNINSDRSVKQPVETSHFDSWHAVEKTATEIDRRQIQILDVSVAQIMRVLLSMLHKQIVHSDEVINNVLEAVKSSVVDLPALILSRSSNAAYLNTVDELKSFVISMALSDGHQTKCHQKCIEIGLLLYGATGGIDNVMAWIEIVLRRFLLHDFVIEKAVFVSILKSLLVGSSSLNREIEEHINECLIIIRNRSDEKFVEITNVLECLLLGIHKALTIYLIRRLNGKIMTNSKAGTKTKSGNFSNSNDIYFWEHCGNIDKIKAAFPDSLTTRLSSSRDKFSIKQALMSQDQIIMVNNMGQVRSRSIITDEIDDLTIKFMLNPCWSPIQFPDVNVKIEKLAVGWANTDVETHILAATTSGQLYSWGCGNFGKLGHGNLQNLTIPKLIQSLSGFNVKQISCGINHSSAVTESGMTFAWGDAKCFESVRCEPYLSPERLKVELLADAICSPNSIFMVSYDRQTLYKRESSIELDMVTYPVPLFSLNLSITLSTESVKIKKIVSNSEGALLLLTNGEIYSIGTGWILGCPTCQKHSTFEKCKAMVNLFGIDIGVSRTHVMVLTNGTLHSWSLLSSEFSLDSKSVGDSATDVFPLWLSNRNRQINLAWNRRYESWENVKRSFSNTFLSIFSWPATISRFRSIMNLCKEHVDSSQFHNTVYLQVLQILHTCLKVNKYKLQSSNAENMKVETKEILTILIESCQKSFLIPEISKIICKVIKIICEVFLKNTSETVSYIKHLLMEKSKTVTCLSLGDKVFLEALILSFKENDRDSSFTNLLYLPDGDLHDILIATSQALSNQIISFQNDISLGRISISESLESINTSNVKILYLFATAGYKICLNRFNKETSSNNNMFHNLCCLFPTVNSILGCFKSYLRQMLKVQKLNKWVTNEGLFFSTMYSYSPMGMILFDVLLFILKNDDLDINPFLPHMESLLLSINEVNIILQSNFTNEIQESRWPLYGFFGNPNFSDVDKDCSSWIWLMDLERVIGLVYGRLIRQIMKPIPTDVLSEKIKLFTDSHFFNCLISMELNLVTVDLQIDHFKEYYDEFINGVLFGPCKLQLQWQKCDILYECGLNIFSIIYSVIIVRHWNDLIKFHNKDNSEDIITLGQIISIINIGNLLKEVFECFEIDMQHSIMNDKNETNLRIYTGIVKMKCDFIFNILNKSLKTANRDTEAMAKVNDEAATKSDSVITDHVALINKAVQSFVNDAKQSFIQFLLMKEDVDDYDINEARDFISQLNNIIYIKRKNNVKVQRSIISINRILGSPGTLFDSVLCQLLHGAIPEDISEQLSNDDDSNFENFRILFSVLLKKLKLFTEPNRNQAVSWRLICSIVSFLTIHLYKNDKGLLDILIENDFINTVFILKGKTSFICTDKWLIVNGSGDFNLLKVSSCIIWFSLEGILLKISTMMSQMSENSFNKIEKSLKNIVQTLSLNLMNCGDISLSNSFDLFSMLNLSKILITSMKFKCDNDLFIGWSELLVDIGTNENVVRNSKMMYSQFSITALALDFLFALMENSDSVNQRLSELFGKISRFFYFCLTDVYRMKINDRIDYMKCEQIKIDDYPEATCSDQRLFSHYWTYTNTNFDFERTFNCSFLASDKVAVDVKNLDQFFILSAESFSSGLWIIEFEVSSPGTGLELICGLILNQDTSWPKDYDSIKVLNKYYSPVSLIGKGSLHKLVTCLIDIDKGYFYFPNANENIQIFDENAKSLKFFLSNCEKISDKPIEIQLLTVKKFYSQHEINNFQTFHYNSAIFPDEYLVLKTILHGLEKFAKIEFDTIAKLFIIPLADSVKYLDNFESFHYQKISVPDEFYKTIFSIFALTGNPNSHRLFRGDICQFSYIENDKDITDEGMIVDFQDPKTEKRRLNGLNFVNKITPESQILCKIFSFNYFAVKTVQLSNVKRKDSSRETTILRKFLKSLSYYNDVVLSLAEHFNRTLSESYFELDIPVFSDEDPWCFDYSEYHQVEFYFAKCLLSKLQMKIFFSKTLLELFVSSNDEKLLKVLEKNYKKVVDLSIKPCPLIKVNIVDSCHCAIHYLFACFNQILHENISGLQKSYVEEYLLSDQMHALHECLSKEERQILLLSVKRLQNGSELFRNIVSRLNERKPKTHSGLVTFNQRRKQILNCSPTDHVNIPQIPIFTPAHEFDSSSLNNSVSSEETVLGSRRSQRRSDTQLLIVDFFPEANKKWNTCPVCGVMLMSKIDSLFYHLSTVHINNCDKTFQHLASRVISSNGKVSVLNEEKLFCASVTSDGYCVCNDFLENKNCNKDPNKDFEVFCKRGLKSNPLIGLSGASQTLFYCYPDVTDIETSDDISNMNIPKIDDMGDNSFEEIFHNKKFIDSQTVDPLWNSNECLCEEIPFICQINLSYIRKAFQRMEYSMMILLSRRLIIKLIKIIYQKQSKADACLYLNKMHLNDLDFVLHFAKLIENNRISFSDLCSNGKDINCVSFKQSDILSILAFGLEISFAMNYEQLNNFMNIYRRCLSNFISSTPDYFSIKNKSDANVFASPSSLVMQIFTAVFLRIWCSEQISPERYSIWKEDVEKTTELLSLGVLCVRTNTKAKIWCLDILIKFFNILKEKCKFYISESESVVDLCGDLITKESQLFSLLDCNAIIRKLFSNKKEQYIITADYEGTLRVWNLNSTDESNHHLNQTLLFSLNETGAKCCDQKKDETAMLDKCLKVTRPLRDDLSSYLMETGVQKFSVSPTGIYVAESIGIYLNVWNIRSDHLNPYVVAFNSIITSLTFPKQVDVQKDGVISESLLLGLADGFLTVLTISENGTKIIEQSLSGRQNNESSITTVSWNRESSPIFVGYNDGLIISTDVTNTETNILTQIHYSRIVLLHHCLYQSLSEKQIFASSATGDSNIGIWNNNRLTCVMSLSSSITSLEWLPELFFAGTNKAVLIVGLSSGLIQFQEVSIRTGEIKCLVNLNGHIAPVVQLNVSSNACLLASGCNKGWINIWHIDDSSLISTFQGDGSVIGIRWTKSNNLVGTWSRSQFLKIWYQFSDCNFDKNGLRQLASMRKLFLKLSHSKSVKHLKNFKALSSLLSKYLTQLHDREYVAVKIGKSICYSHLFRHLIQFCCEFDIARTFSPSFNKELVYEHERNNAESNSNVYQRNCQDRKFLVHYLNLNKSLWNSFNNCYEWLSVVDDFVKLTRSVCLTQELPDNVVPQWWWICCLGSNKYMDECVNARWRNKYWSAETQIELLDLYRSLPHKLIDKYSNSTYIWGNGDKGELGFQAQMNHVNPVLLNFDGIDKIVCGNGVTLAITIDGKLMACGEGLEMNFNPYMREEAHRFISVPFLSDFRISHVSVSKGPESHVIVITSFGDVYSWGHGSAGKLGHGSSSTYKKPIRIEELKGQVAIQASCGFMHSAVVTDTGELYTFGLGNKGQLGINFLCSSSIPRLVLFDRKDVKIGMVSCGSDHTLALSQDGLSLYAFGDGEFGKLGTGDFTDHPVPAVVLTKKESLLKICCGKEFSMALTSRGQVLVWGHYSYLGLYENFDPSDMIHLNIPTVNGNLSSLGLFCDIEAGNETAFATSVCGYLYGWGSNAHGLLLSTNVDHFTSPVKISGFDNLRQISCGRNHAAASSHPPNPYRHTLPTCHQFLVDDLSNSDISKYHKLVSSEFTNYDLISRLLHILFWNELLNLSWQYWLPQRSQFINESFEVIDEQTESVWPILNPETYLIPFSKPVKIFEDLKMDCFRQLVRPNLLQATMNKYIVSSMITGRRFSSLVSIDRITKTDSVFVQTCGQVLNMDPREFRLPWRPWKVKLVNEGADDAGGAYDETISAICKELENPLIQPRILIPTPNDNHTFLLNPDPYMHQEYFYFLGILMATAIRTKKPIDIHLDPLIWKLIVRSVVSYEDIVKIDPTFFKCLLMLKNIDLHESQIINEIYCLNSFLCFSSNTSETEVMYKGLKKELTVSNAKDYVARSMHFRLHEFDDAVDSVRQGMKHIIPMIFLDIVTWNQLERMVCGSKSISVSLLQSITRYVDTDESNIIFQWLWEILETFSENEKSLFLRFMTGKSRLPSDGSQIPFRLFMYLSKKPVENLPQAQTCFNQLRLPQYGSRSELETKLRIAIHECRCIDMDDYMLIQTNDH